MRRFACWLRVALITLRLTAPQTAQQQQAHPTSYKHLTQATPLL
ncbi:hypothetical protein [Chthonomonas calidirosea]|nr:hypothetical protein [Chthonomonas calidirosea]